MKKKAGQVWGFDLMMAVGLFLVGIIIFYIYSLNLTTDAQETLSQMDYTGNSISDSLLSPGYPEDWTSSDVIRIGLTTDNKLDQDKLEKFYALDYQKTKQIFKTEYNYYLNLSIPLKISGVAISGIGQISTNTKNLVKISRVSIYNNEPVTLYLYIWN